jgi:hypothetical protein
MNNITFINVVVLISIWDKYRKDRDLKTHSKSKYLNVSYVYILNIFLKILKKN